MPDNDYGDLDHLIGDYLEELTERVTDFEAETQTDFLLDRPEEPLFMPAMPWELGGQGRPPSSGGDGNDWSWMQSTGPAIGATNGLMPVAEPGDHDAFIAWACSSDSVVTPWVVRVRHWVV